MTVAHSVARLEHKGLRLESGDAGRLRAAHDVVLRERRDLIGQQRRKHRARRPVFDPDQLRVGQIAGDLLVVADDFPRRTFEVHQLFVLAGGIDVVDDSRRFDAIAVLVQDRADVIQALRGRRGALQPVGRFTGVYVHGPNEPEHDQPRPRGMKHCLHVVIRC